MPIYEYNCSTCGTDFEALHRVGGSARCPGCDSEAVARRQSVPAVKSSGTHAQAMRAAKKRDAGQASDRLRERLRYEESHDRHG